MSQGVVLGWNLLPLRGGHGSNDLVTRCPRALPWLAFFAPTGAFELVFFGPKGQKPLAQGNALGKIRSYNKTALKGQKLLISEHKSFIVFDMIEFQELQILLMKRFFSMVFFLTAHIRRRFRYDGLTN